MKRIIVTSFILALTATFCLSAQQQQNESYLYPRTFFIYRVHAGSKGYRMDYIRQNSSRASFYAPYEWFGSQDSIGRIVLSNKDKAFPYMTFFFKDGEVDHFRLYLIENRQHTTWSQKPLSKKESESFPSPDAKPEVLF